ncbi:MAG: ribonuclease HII [Alphaproteobacteria bacterium]
MLADIYERSAKAKGCTVVCGVDEVGRGPLAGPVVAAAVVVPWDTSIRAYLLERAGDSKVLTAKKREALAPYIHAHCTVSIAEASVAEIDAMNIRQATHLAMGRAVEGIERCSMFDGRLPNTREIQPHCLVDGNDMPNGLVGHTVVKGDAVELAIACASIVAKVYRDTLMAELDTAHPGYGWASNAGYGSAGHMEALQRLGATVHHRTSFAPVREVVERDAQARAA